MSDTEQPADVTALTVQLLTAYLSNNSVAPTELAALVRDTKAALIEEVSAAPVEPATETVTPAVSIRKSLASPDHILSLIDGRPYKTLKRHLAANGLTPDAYRTRYGLAADYPMVAPTFAERRRAIAAQVGLGRRPAAPAAAAKPQVKEEPSATASAPAETPTAPAPAKTVQPARSAKAPAKAAASTAKTKSEPKARAPRKANDAAKATENAVQADTATKPAAAEPAAEAAPTKKATPSAAKKAQTPSSDGSAAKTAKPKAPRDKLSLFREVAEASAARAAKGKTTAKSTKPKVATTTEATTPKPSEA